MKGEVFGMRCEEGYGLSVPMGGIKNLIWQVEVISFGKLGFFHLAS